MARKYLDEGGFTAAELSIVVLILGLLVAIAIPVFSNQAVQAKTRSCQSDLRIINGAIQSYAAEHRVPPGTVGELVPKYLKKIPNCPVERLHVFSLIGDQSDPPVQSRVLCGDNNGRGGIDDQDHFN